MPTRLHTADPDNVPQLSMSYDRKWWVLSNGLGNWTVSIEIAHRFGAEDYEYRVKVDGDEFNLQLLPDEELEERAVLMVEHEEADDVEDAKCIMNDAGLLSYSMFYLWHGYTIEKHVEKLFRRWDALKLIVNPTINM